MNCAQIEMISRVETYYIIRGQKSLIMEGRDDRARRLQDDRNIIV